MVDTSRPYVICHMMSTIEGKITSGIDGVDILGDYFTLYTQLEDKLHANAWLIGRVTMQMFASGINTTLPAVTRDIELSDFVANHTNTHFMFAIDTKGVLRWDKNTITLSNVAEPLQLIVIALETTPKEYLKYLQKKNISYLIAGKDKIDFPLLLRKIQQIFHVTKLLLEGGGKLNGSLMAEGLIDEISLLITPIVLNRSDAPSVFEGKTQEKLNVKKYKIHSIEQVGNNCIWVRYENTAS